MIDTRAIRDRARRPRGCSPTGSAGRDRPTRSAPRLGRSASSTSFTPEQDWFRFFEDPAHPELARVHRIDWFTDNTDPRHRCIGRWAAGTTSVPADAHRTGRHSGSARAVPRGQSGTHARQSEVRMIEVLLARALQRLPKQSAHATKQSWRADLAVGAIADWRHCAGQSACSAPPRNCARRAGSSVRLDPATDRYQDLFAQPSRSPSSTD